MKSVRLAPALAGAASLLLGGSPAARAFVFPVTSAKVTNVADRFTRHPDVDKRGKNVIFVSRAPHKGIAPPFEFDATFDFDGTGNDFSSGGAPSPACPTCSDVADTDNPANLYLWNRSTNEVRQLTFAVSGGDSANRWPSIDARAAWAAWDSDRDHVPGAPGNADANGEIFLINVSSGEVTQVTDTTGGGADANRRASLGDKGRILAFESTRDFAGDPDCHMPDGTTPCANGDGNSEILLYARETGELTQLTSTTGDSGGVASERARLSVDGRFVVFESTRDFATEPTPGTTCAQLDGETTCANGDGNSEIVYYDRKERHFVQLTATGAGLCSGQDANQRPDVSKKGKYVVFQSKCEDELNPGGCGSCLANNEIFLVSMKRREIHQVTLSDAGRNRFARISGTSAYVAFQSDRAYAGENPLHDDVLYLLRRSSTATGSTLTSRTQLLEDAVLAGGGLVQNPTVRLVVPDIAGGFDTDFERIGLSVNGKYLAVHNAHATPRQEIWLVDRTRK